ncbi:hypothetical protein [Providencia stuartii]|nr:Uncharacterised protein [Acinetobacter baumannii]
MANNSKLSKHTDTHSLVGVSALSDGTRYAIIAYDGDLYAVKYRRYLKDGFNAICECNDWLCYLIRVVRRSDKNGSKSVLISRYNDHLKKEVIEEFELSKQWRREMMNKGIGITANYQKRRVLLAWLKHESGA